MQKATLSDRMKGYEFVSDNKLMNRVPVIIRIDGKAFHTFTRGCNKPFDLILMESMQQTAKFLCENVQGCKLAYVQSDEISLLLTDYESIDTQSWFDYRINKVCSISASMATLAFNKFIFEKVLEMKNSTELSDTETFWEQRMFQAMFDSRAYNVPKEDVCNYFLWRQQDATRNAIQMVGQANFSHKELQGKSCNQIQEMLWQERNINFNDLPVSQKRGTCVVKNSCGKWNVDLDIPIFSQDRDYINNLVFPKLESEV